MSSWRILAIALVPCGTTLAAAQATARPVDPVFVRAQTMVSDGNGAAGRALVDSVLKATPAYAPMYPQALFWRASLASNAADAESDYKHIVVDYPLAPQAEDALLRLAQLELARGDRDGALGHLQQIPRDYPRSKSLARASYWTARVLFEKNDIPDACVANANALSQAATDEIELRNQIQYQGQRCPAVPAASAVISAAPTVSSVVPTASSTPSQQKPVVNPPVTVSPSVEEKAQPPVQEKPQEKLKASSESEKTKAAPEPVKTVSTGIFSVQVAAYNHKADAETLVSALIKRGYQARVDGDTVPFRVRIGRYATENDAEAALKRIKAKRMDGFVVRVTAR